jgi:hypothetical protein
MTKKELGKIPGDPDPKPYKLYRVDQAGEQIERVGEHATLEEMRATKRRLDWRYAEYLGRKKIEEPKRRFKEGDTVRFRAKSRVPLSFDITPGEVGKIIGVEPHPPQTGPTYRIRVQFARVLVEYTFEFEYELVNPAA